jgi:hypothetical protein
MSQMVGGLGGFGLGLVVLRAAHRSQRPSASVGYCSIVSIKMSMYAAVGLDGAMAQHSATLPLPLPLLLPLERPAVTDHSV